ncbi:MAG: DUF952 domain-containing protein [Polyangiaceae bacterium]
MRWLYHIRPVMQATAWPYAPPSLLAEGFVHASFRDRVEESAQLYFPRDATLEVLRLDPRKIRARVEIAMTPRGEMPHIFGAIERAAVDRIMTLAEFAASQQPDFVTG